MRLIDADSLKEDNTWLWYDEWGNRTAACEAVDNAPTIKPKPSHDWNGWENGCGRTYDFEPKKGRRLNDRV